MISGADECAAPCAVANGGRNYAASLALSLLARLSF
jgi:hypothetical protein